MVSASDLISGRDGLHRLDDLLARAREDHAMASAAADAQVSRRSELVRLRAEGYRELAKIRLDIVKSGDVSMLTAAETKALTLLDAHEDFLERIDGLTDAAAEALGTQEAARREAEVAADAALAAYEKLVAETEASLQDDPGYLELRQAKENAGAVAARAGQKLELAKADREDKSAPYENDPLFGYLWERKFRTTDYRGRGIIRSLDNWVAQVCGYDAAYLNYARLIELPDRLAEHVGRVALEEAEAEDAIGRFEAAKLEAAGGLALAATLDTARARLKAVDADLAAAEAHLHDLRVQQERAASGDAGPLGEAARLIEDSLVKASFPDLKVLAAETTTPDDDRIVDVLIRLRTEELQLELTGKSAALLPARRRESVDALEHARRRFKEAGFDSPYVGIGRSAFEVALEAYGRGADPDGERLWRAIAATVRQAPGHDDDYFGGRRRGRSVGVPDGVVGGVIGAVVSEVIKEASRSSGRGRWGGSGPWGGGGSGGSSGKSGGRSGGFKTKGRIGGGGFKTKGRF